MNQQGSSRSRGSLVLGSIAAILYFSEGLPYGIVKEFVPLYLRVRHVDLTDIGLLNIVGFAWTLKFLWSPFVDAIGTYKRWVAAAILGIAIALAGMAAASTPGPLFYALVALLALSSATQDIAVDAFTIRMTPTKLLGPINSIRVTAYRIALTAPGVLAVVGQYAGWPHAFAAAAIVAAIVLIVSILMEPRLQPGAEAPVEAGAPSNFIAAFRHWLLRPRAGVLLAIAFTYRLGELTIVSMIKPFWVDRGFSPAEIGTITSIVGVVVSILGAILGGALLPRLGIYRGLLWLGIAQCASNIGYALVSMYAAGRWEIYAAAIVENLGYGLGTAAFLAFLMSICDRERAATEYALLSAAYGFTGTIMASASGWLVKQMGYSGFFWLTVVLGLPALLLIPIVRDQIVAQEAEH